MYFREENIGLRVEQSHSCFVLVFNEKCTDKATTPFLIAVHCSMSEVRLRNDTLAYTYSLVNVSGPSTLFGFGTVLALKTMFLRKQI